MKHLPLILILGLLTGHYALANTNTGSINSDTAIHQASHAQNQQAKSNINETATQSFNTKKQIKIKRTSKTKIKDFNKWHIGKSHQVKKNAHTLGNNVKTN